MKIFDLFLTALSFGSYLSIPWLLSKAFFDLFLEGVLG